MNTDHTTLMTALARCAAALGHPAEVTYVARRGYLYAALGERWESSPGVPCAKAATPEVRAYAEREALRLLASHVSGVMDLASYQLQGVVGDLTRVRSRHGLATRWLTDAERALAVAEQARRDAQNDLAAITRDLHAAEAAYDARASEHPKAALAQAARDELTRAMRG